MEAAMRALDCYERELDARLWARRLSACRAMWAGNTWQICLRASPGFYTFLKATDPAMLRRWAQDR
jgi:hypothetical protein